MGIKDRTFRYHLKKLADAGLIKKEELLKEYITNQLPIKNSTTSPSLTI